MAISPASMVAIGQLWERFYYTYIVISDDNMNPRRKYVKIFLVCISWFVVSIGLSLANKAIFQSFRGGFPFPVPRPRRDPPQS
jgi:hypothetical protein